ncbi:hypothetical protein MPSEU_001089600 [Mayamaea pseudoterrestris]|nr:hypothetical protein MPSEU_001089600 [Mayamaea pseudoterrestris]
MSHSLVPIRVDAWSADKSTRIVDTFLLDPVCWPIRSSEPSVMVEENTQYLADTILLDADVMGMGRAAASTGGDSGSKFTGRLQLWNFSLQQRLCDQIRGQLWRVLMSTSGPRREWQQPKQQLSLESKRHSVQQQQTNGQGDSVIGKRTSEAAASEDDGRPLKRMKLENDEALNTEKAAASNDAITSDVNTIATKTDSTSQAETAPFSMTETEEVTSAGNPGSNALHFQPSASTAPPHQGSTQPRPLTVASHQQSAARDPIYGSKMPLGNLIPIRIRLTAFGIRIHDDFYVDPVLDTSPLVIAQSIAKDLNLSDDLLIALAVDICEQIHGMQMNQEPILPAYDMEQGAKSSTEGKNVTAAYRLDQKVHIANVAHLVHDYRA